MQKPSGLNRLTSYQLTTPIACPVTGTGAKAVTYDAIGNILSKTGVGT